MNDIRPLLVIGCGFMLACSLTTELPIATDGRTGDGGGGQSTEGRAGGDACESERPPETECASYLCVDGAWQMHPALYGEEVSSQLTGDCKLAICDGEGGTALVASDDIPNDHNPCTSDRCEAGTAVHTPLPGALCGLGLGVGYCTGAAVCVECLDDSHCLDSCVQHVCTD